MSSSPRCNFRIWYVPANLLVPHFLVQQTLEISSSTLEHTELILASCPDLSSLELQACVAQFHNNRAADHKNLQRLELDNVTIAADELANLAARCTDLSLATLQLTNAAPLAFLHLAAKSWPQISELSLTTQMPTRSIECATVFRFLVHAPRLTVLVLPALSMDPAEAVKAAKAWYTSEPPEYAMSSFRIGDVEVALPPHPTAAAASPICVPAHDDTENPEPDDD